MWLGLLKVTFVVLLPLGGSIATSLTFALLAAWAFLGPRQAVEALALAVLPAALNPGLWPEPGTGAVAIRWLVVAASFVRVCIGWDFKAPAHIRWLAMFGAFLIPLQAVTSFDPGISLVKIITFILAALAALIGLWRTRGYDWSRFFLSFMLGLVLMSAPLMISAIGYYRNGSGFQGVTNQPQFYGALLAPLLAWLIARIYTKQLGSRWWFLVILGLFQLVLSASRNAALALILGLGFTVISRLFSQRAFRHLSRTSILGWLVVVFVGCAVAVASIDHVQNFTEQFIQKHADTGAGDVIGSKRQDFIHDEWENFLFRPAFGIGFGIPSKPDDTIVTRIAGIPVSAPVEKGFWYLTVLEETGLVGAFFVILIIFSLFRFCMRPGTSASCALIVTALATNLAEATLFSAGGLGLLLWVLLGYGCAESARRSRISGVTHSRAVTGLNQRSATASASHFQRRPKTWQNESWR